MYIITIESLKQITKNDRYFATKLVGNKVKIMADDGAIRFYNKSHFRSE